MDTHFLCRSREGSLNWSRGVPRSWLQRPWDELVYIIQNFVNCEGRFSIVYLYHIKILQHLKREKIINMPCYFLKSLSKMSMSIQKQTRNEEKSLYHYGLIKMLIVHQLQEHGITWEQFLLINRFIEEKGIDIRHDEIEVYEIPNLEEKTIFVSGKEIIEVAIGTRRMTRAMKRKEEE